MEMPQIARPIPRRPFELNPASTDSSLPPSPATESSDPDLLPGQKSDSTPSRTRSILNLTSSTLLGIYSPTGYDEREDSSTPWGTGAQTPVQRRSIDDYNSRHPSSLTWNRDADKPRLKGKRKDGHRHFVPFLLQTFLLFAFGIGYGSIVTHLHRQQLITPVPVPNTERHSLYYQLSWGVFGVLLGNALPLVDSFWEKTVSPAIASRDQVGQDDKSQDEKSSATAGEASGPSYDSGLGPIWYSAVRSIGVFVGIAFAVRRLPWQSTLQVAGTLALANPALWYMIDRSLPGFALSAAVGTIGTVVLLLLDPNFVPLPAIHQPTASEQFGVYTWLASILFCTSLCFGAVGRRLQL
ncbi:hypothetical protein HRR83_009266 [Exophiala dermatitidis]|uniref:INSIG domain-containing protein n=2 Tax=Exophiala dermatitidis TaxID=5970 RepID=H6BNY0_EXODN|nr:uncharacterized protein HMPREF1120_00612 [Exophiala dermatitidis NIH/UT8656]KAJ4502085.1 hypothetical protein HRR75_008673 [Exophiala dermatitidis]EHY52398.1 hypothetical protein HMPREF1120_00612 [Exophiala dermatitidis NIH/UT8656]KAJ4502553.1 hypothetical protein HRR73_009421 [Exophiala dermatitidis]KAJ4503040.1 hypothetical protein HRR74_009429 [Exophiala dermatitidis]KAJ4531655.1 hypothetical protein HRR77_009306 [Exophiala dermatitidis]